MAKTLSDEELSAVARHWYARCARAGVREWLQALAPGELADVRGDAGECARRVVESQVAVDGADAPGTPTQKLLTLGAWNILGESGFAKAEREDATALLPLMREVVRAEIEDQFRKVFASSAAAPTPPQPRAKRSAAARKPLSAHEDPFLDWKGDIIGDSARTSYRMAFRRFREVAGDRAFGDYTKDDAVAFLDNLMASGGARHGKERKARATLKKELGHLRGLFDWAISRNYREANPFADVRPAPAKKGAVDKFKKRDFSREELQRIFAAPLFMGARSSHFSHEPGALLIADGRFWMPLVALLTGARLGELAQLRPSDIRSMDDVDWLFITNQSSPDDDAEDRARSQKTENAERSIPILPALRRLGFLDYVDHRRELGESRLFAERAYGHYFNQRFLVKLCIKDPTVSFHSFRHSYKQMLRRSIPSDETKNRLMGHAAATVGEAYGPTLLVEEAQLFLEVCAPRVDLAHIVPYMRRNRPIGLGRSGAAGARRSADVATAVFGQD